MLSINNSAEVTSMCKKVTEKNPKEVYHNNSFRSQMKKYQLRKKQ